MNIPITNASLNVTQNCNLECPYCFAHEKTQKRMSFEIGKKCVDFLLKNALDANINHLAGKRRVVDISFWGGEPLIEWKMIQKLVEYSENCELSKDVVVGFSGTTNGTLLTEDKLDFLADHNIFFMVSIDGMAETHNRNRKFRDGRGSHAIIMKNMETVLKRWPWYNVRLSILADRVDHFFEDMKYLIDSGFKTLVFSPVYESAWTDEKWEIFEEQYKALADLNLERRDFKLEHLEQYAEPYPNRFPCGAGRFYVGIDIDGAIYPCHRFNKFDDYRLWNEKEVCIGHVDFGITNPAFRQQFIDGRKCFDCSSDCDMTPCKGGCPATNYDLGGTLNHTSLICKYTEIMKRVSKYWLEKVKNPPALSLLKELETEMVDRLLTLEKKWQ